MSDALNFTKPELRIVGVCDVYTTKAAGSDKKLYKSIDRQLEERYAKLVEFDEELKPLRAAQEEEAKEAGHDGPKRKRSPYPTIPHIDLSRSSPFGSLHNTSARHTFAYLVATLNATYPGYDLSLVLRPEDFRREPSLTEIQKDIDSTMANLQPGPSRFRSFQGAPITKDGVEIWNPNMWARLEKELRLRQCERYSWRPQPDQLSYDLVGLWSKHYFFFNRVRKRVCYLHFRARSRMGRHAGRGPYRTTDDVDDAAAVDDGEDDYSDVSDLTDDLEMEGVYFDEYGRPIPDDAWLEEGYRPTFNTGRGDGSMAYGST